MEYLEAVNPKNKNTITPRFSLCPKRRVKDLGTSTECWWCPSRLSFRFIGSLYPWSCFRNLLDLSSKIGFETWWSLLDVPAGVHDDSGCYRGRTTTATTTISAAAATTTTTRAAAQQGGLDRAASDFVGWELSTYQFWWKFTKTFHEFNWNSVIYFSWKGFKPINKKL